MNISTAIRRFFTGKPGATTAEERQRRLTLSVLAIIFAAMLFTLVGRVTTNPANILALQLGVALIIISILLAWQGITLPGRILSPLALIGITTFILLGFNAVQNPGMAAYGVALIIAALLLGEWGAVIFGFLIAALTGTIALLQVQGALPNPVQNPVEITDAIILIIAYPTSAMLLWLMMRQFNQLVREARQNEQRQIEANRELRVLQTGLEGRVEERTRELNSRTDQLEAAGFVARRVAEIVDLETLLNEVVRLISERFNFYHAAIYLADPGQRYVELHAASSAGGRRLIDRGHRLAIGRQGMVGNVAHTRRGKVALDTGNDAFFAPNPELPQTRSEMALPLVVREQLIGVLDIQSAEPAAFTPADTSTFQTMADQVALAIENARLIQRSQSALKRIEADMAQSTLGAWKELSAERPNVYENIPLGLKSGRRSASRDDAARLTVPLNLRGQKIGDLVLSKGGASTQWTGKERDMVSAIALQLGVALESARALEESQRSAVRERTIGEITGQFTRALDMDALLQMAVRELQSLPNVAEVSVFVGQADDKK
jgi:GAF domain-containing protein